MNNFFHYDTQIVLINGDSIPIGQIVDQKLDLPLFSYNQETNSFQETKITHWHDLGKISSQAELTHIETNSIDSSSGGRYGLSCSNNQKILTNLGFKNADTICLEDRFLSKYLQQFNSTLKDFLSGTLVGDSNITIRDKLTASLRIQDNKNNEYALWKKEKLSKFFNFKTKIENNLIKHMSDYSFEFSKIKAEIGQRNPMYLLNNFSDLGFAMWYMDDGHYDSQNYHSRMSISIKRFSENIELLEEIKLAILREFDLNPTEMKIDKLGGLHFLKRATHIIQDRIKEYIHPSMQYKLAEPFKGYFKEFELDSQKTYISHEVEVKLIERSCSKRQFRNKRKFNLTVENGNFLVGGIRNGIVVKDFSN